MSFEQSNSRTKTDWLSEFLSFEKMLTPVLVKVIFVLWLGACVLFSLVGGVSRLVNVFRGHYDFGMAKLVLAILVLVLGSLGARLFCELVIVIFRIHDCAEQIARNTALLAQMQQRNEEQGRG
ncbi:MAG: DUF4282 domain-containing protein [Acidobacteriota bacterium]